MRRISMERFSVYLASRSEVSWQRCTRLLAIPTWTHSERV
jgi:hypothetical protein